MTAAGPGVGRDSAARQAANAATDTYVTLTIAGQLCGIAVGAVRDVLGDQAITRIPLAPREVAGSLNLRGRIVTAIDLRRRLGLAPAEAAARRMSVVVELGGELYSLQVDEVGEVMSLPRRDIEENPPTLNPLWRQVTQGIHRLDCRLLAVLEVGRLLDFGKAGGH